MSFSRIYHISLILIKAIGLAMLPTALHLVGGLTRYDLIYLSPSSHKTVIM